MERLVEWNCKEKGSALPKCINELGDTVSMEDICAQLATIYDILGDDYNLDRLQELVDADKDGRCVLLHASKHSNEDGENALKSAMNTCYYHNNPVTRYIADAVAEKIVRESSNAALVENNDANPQNNYFMNRFMKVK